MTPPRISRLCALTLSATLLGCDPLVTFLGSVTVPSEVQAEFSDTQRGLVLLTTDNVHFPRAVLGVLCSPQAEPLHWSIREQGVACAADTVARVKIVRAPRTVNDQPCGAHRDFFPQTPEQLAVVAQGEQRIFPGMKPGHFCDGGKAKLDITVK